MPTMSPEAIKDATRRFVDELYNKGNTAVVNEQLAPNFVYHTVMPPMTKDRAGVIQEAMALRTAFPDLHMTVDDMLLEGNKGMLRWTLRGTHEGEFYGIPPTHKQVTWSGIALEWDDENGKGTDWWNYLDEVGFFQQLGTFPQQFLAPESIAPEGQAYPQA